MPKFRKKPVVIEAVKWMPTLPWKIMDAVTKQNTWPHEIMVWECGVYSERNSMQTAMTEPVYYIDTLEGRHEVTPGDWIITGVKGEKYPCKPDIFAMTYDAVEEPNA